LKNKGLFLKNREERRSNDGRKKNKRREKGMRSRRNNLIFFGQKYL